MWDLELLNAQGAEKNFKANFVISRPILLRSAWDNAKKYIEKASPDSELQGKGSDIHKAAVVGDTVGDPFKDTSGPALNIVMKLMAVLSLVFADTFYAVNNGSGLLKLG